MARKNSNGTGKVVAEAKVAQDAQSEETVRSPLFVAARRLMLAYVGGVALAWDELEDLVERLVERGEVAEKDARKLLAELAEKRKTISSDSRVQSVLDRMDVPTKADIHALSAKIATLTAKVEELKKAQHA